MSRAAQPVEISEPDLLDRIANALPTEIRAEYYREMRHCRSLPENDEMLRILRAMQFLTLLTLQVPERMVSEREKLEGSLKEAVAAMRKFQEASATYHGVLDERLSQLPGAIASGIGPEAIAARINENLRQQFTESTIPQVAEALTVVAREMKTSTVEFSRMSAKLGDTYTGAVVDARQAVEGIEAAVSRAAESGKRAAENLSWTFSQAYRWSVHSFTVIALLLGMLLGMMADRWIISLKHAPETHVQAPAEQAPKDASKHKR